MTHVEKVWTEPRFERFFTRLASFARVMVFDKRGVGLSDRVSEDRLPSLEVRMDDARAVMDAVASERAVVLGVSEGGPMAMLFAATYPERTIGLVVYGTSSCWNNAPDYPWSVPAPIQRTGAGVGRAARPAVGDERARHRPHLGVVRPDLAHDEPTVAWIADYMRNAASPGAAGALSKMNRSIDVRSALPAIHVPTLVLARDGDIEYPVEETKWMADDHGARFVSVPGTSTSSLSAGRTICSTRSNGSWQMCTAPKPTSTGYSPP